MAPTISPFSKLTKQQVIGFLKATNSKDEDVLFARKEEILTLVKAPKSMFVPLIVIGVCLTITVFLAMLGIPLILFSFWAKNRGVLNIAVLDDTYKEYLATIRT